MPIIIRGLVATNNGRSGIRIEGDNVDIDMSDVYLSGNGEDGITHISDRAVELSRNPIFQGVDTALIQDVLSAPTPQTLADAERTLEHSRLGTWLLSNGPADYISMASVVIPLLWGALS